MVRKVTNRRTGPATKEHPTGKHESLLQSVTYTDSIENPMSDKERSRMIAEFNAMGAITKPNDIDYLLDRYRNIAIQYLDNCSINYKACEGWEWGHSLTDEYKDAAELDGGFVSAFNILRSIGHVQNKLAQGKHELALAFALHIGFSTRQLVIAEMQALYIAADLKIKAANDKKSKDKEDIKEIAKPYFIARLDAYEAKYGKRCNRDQAAKDTAKYLETRGDKYKRSWITIKQWFPAKEVP